MSSLQCNRARPGVELAADGMSVPRSSHRLLRVLCVLIVAVAVPAAFSTATAAANDSAARLAGAPAAASADSPTEHVSVKDRYIVVLKANAGTRAQGPVVKKALSLGATISYRYVEALNGFAATLPSRALAEVKRDPHVEYVERDARLTLDTTQAPAPWGLDRIDQRQLPLSGSYTYTPTGFRVNAYVIDTGIRHTHVQFGGRAIPGFSVYSPPHTDCNGHGTHVAGILGGATYGVAKQVVMRSVRIANCFGEGTMGSALAGIDWVTRDHQPGQPAVATLAAHFPGRSFGIFTINRALDAAVSASIADGVTYVVPAGNNDSKACNQTPARIPSAITVGATTGTDDVTSYSNYGSCVDLFAPGSGTSSWSNSDVSAELQWGTSISAAYGAGVAALYLEQHPQATPAQVSAALVASATPGVLRHEGSGSPNLLLYSPLDEPARCKYTGRMSDDQLLYASDSECVQSTDGRYRLVMQSDSNLVLYGPRGRGLWSSRTVGRGVNNVRMQSDGNLVIYRANGTSPWHSGTFRYPHATLEIQTDGNVDIYDSQHRPRWSTHTSGQQ